MKNMNRKQKIIVSITGIFIVLLILVGLTYAYFLTRISGNTNTKSISVTTADLKLTYGDGNGIIAPTDKLLPGTTLQSKTFTVTNEGDSKTEYGVIFDKVFNELSRQQDLVYTLSCTSTIGNCNGVSTETIFPNGGGTKDNGTGYGIAVTNSIEKDAVHTYTLVVKYLDPNVDQSEDMGKTIQARVNIADMKSLNPYSSDTTNTVAKAVVNNAIALTSAQKAKGYAEFLATPKTTPAKEKSLKDEASLSMTTDDDGITYYYRGAVNNNYVNFANRCWRIVRIAGDGSIKLILDDNTTTCNSSTYTRNWTIGDEVVYGYDSNYYPDYENYSGGLKTSLTTWYNSNMKSYESKLKSESICLGDLTTKYNKDDSTGAYTTGKYDTTFDYAAVVNARNGVSTLRCSGIKANSSFVYTITEDEVLHSGAVYVDRSWSDIDPSNFYLNGRYTLGEKNNFGWYSFWTITPSYRLFGRSGVESYVTNIFTVDLVGKNGTIGVIDDFYARPMVTLKKGTVFSSGDGYKTTPFVVS